MIALTGTVRDKRLLREVLPLVEDTSRALPLRAAAFGALAIYQGQIFTAHVADRPGSGVVSIGERTHSSQYDGAQPLDSADFSRIRAAIERLAQDHDRRSAFGEWARYLLVMSAESCKYENLRSHVRGCPPAGN
jgi:hypothetical protein